MRRGATLFAVLLLVIFISTCGCSVLSPGDQNAGDSNTVTGTQGRQPSGTQVPTRETPVPTGTVTYAEHVSCEQILACYPPANGLVKEQIHCYEDSPREGEKPATLYSSATYGHYDNEGLFYSEIFCQASDTAGYMPEETIVKMFEDTPDDIPMRIQGYPGADHFVMINNRGSHDFHAVVHTRFFLNCGATTRDADFGKERGLQFINAFDFRCLEELG